MLRLTPKLLLSSGLLVLAACGPIAKVSAPLPLESAVGSPWPEGGATEAIEPGRSEVRIQVFSAGRVPKLGHNHVLTVPRLKGRVWTPAAGHAGGHAGGSADASAGGSARFELSFRLDELELDRPELRTRMGPAFASVLDADAVAGTRMHMLGPDNLQADRYPLVRLQSVHVAGSAPHMTAEVDIELHGQHRLQTVPLEIEREHSAWVVRGAFKLRQSDYGVTPYSVLGGLLAVQDELSIDFVLRTGP